MKTRQFKTRRKRTEMVRCNKCEIKFTIQTQLERHIFVYHTKVQGSSKEVAVKYMDTADNYCLYVRV